jgi:hypothetical protein
MELTLLFMRSEKGEARSLGQIRAGDPCATTRGIGTIMNARHNSSGVGVGGGRAS